LFTSGEFVMLSERYCNFVLKDNWRILLQDLLWLECFTGDNNNHNLIIILCPFFQDSLDEPVVKANTFTGIKEILRFVFMNMV